MSIRYFIHRVARLFQWAKIIWQTDDFDGNYCTLRIMKYHLSRVSKHIKEHQWIVNADKYARRIEIAEMVLNRILEDNYEDMYEHSLYKIWGKEETNFGPPDKTRTLGEFLTYSHEYHHLVFDAAYKQKMRDREWLFNYMHKHMDHWWD